MATQIISGGTQVINDDVEESGGTQIISSGTQVLADKTSGLGATFTGGLLRKGDAISGWVIDSKIQVQSGEADLYIAFKDGKKGVIKYYRGNIHPKDGLLENLVNLNHPDIINVYEYGTFNNHFYEIMEFAEGGSLDTRDEQGNYALLPLSEEQVFQVCKEVINSFKTIHEKGIIHRDIKPANIYYRDKERTDVVIGDFGISSLMDENKEGVSHKTQTASRTTGYAAPEVLSGIITAKMDYYALGITLWELATGKDPFVMPNGKRRNDAHLIRDTIEGRIADDLLSREPFLSDRLQHLIRGLLVIDDKLRWGYDEVTRFLNGENVEVAQKRVKDWSFSIGNQSCTTLEELGIAIAKNPEVAKKSIYHGTLSGFLEDKYPDIVKKMDNIIEETSANNQYKVGIAKIIWLLKPDYPFEIDSKYKAENIEDIINFLVNAPEKMIPILEDKESSFYPYIEHLGYEDKIEEIKEISRTLKDQRGWRLMEKVYHIAIILKDKVIKPFKLERYKDFELSELSQLDSVPSDLREYVVNLIQGKCFEGFLFPWITLMAGKGIDWDNFRKWDDIKKIRGKEEGYIVVSQDGFGDYKSITEAYNAAQKGNVIDIKNGVYNEKLDIEKEIEITSSDFTHPVINLKYGESWTVLSSKVKISNIDFMGIKSESTAKEEDPEKFLLVLNKECTIENCKFNTEIFSSSICIYADSNIQNCEFTSMLNRDETFIGEKFLACLKTGPYNINVKGCSFSDLSQDNITILDEVFDVRDKNISWTIDGCKFINCERDCIALESNNFSHAEWLDNNKILITVTDSVFENCNFDSINIQSDGIEVVIKNSKLNSSSIVLTVYKSIIENCNFIDSMEETEGGGIIYIDGKEDENECVISDCTFEGCDSDKEIGINVSYHPNCTIKNCNLKSLGNNAIVLEHSKANIEQCNIDSCAGGIIILYDGVININQCNIKSCKKDGICFSSIGYKNINKKSCICKNCVIENNGYTGIYVYAETCDMTVENTVIKNNESSGVLLICNEFHITNCEINGNRDGGVDLFIKDGVFSKCNIHDNSYNNLRLQGDSKVSFDNCSIYGSNAINVYAWGKSYCSFDNCLIRDAKLSNIEIKEKSNISFNNCKINKSLGNGINVIEKGTLSVSSCEISDNEKIGILQGKKAKVKTVSCNFLNNKENDRKKDRKL